MPTARAWMACAALLLGAVLVAAPLAQALDVSTRAIRVVGSSEHPDNVQSYASETSGGPNEFDGSGIGIAVLDTGVDNEHPTFGPNQFVAGAQMQTPCLGDDCIEDENPDGDGCLDPDDTDGHGTHVASIALGQGGSGVGPRGVAPGAHLIDVKIASSLGGISLQGIQQGIDWVIAYNNGDAACEPTPPVDVISLSFGTTSPHDSKEYDDAMRAVEKATDEGILVVAAAGNCGPSRSGTNLSCSGQGGEKDTIVSPGAAREALTVGALDDRASERRAQDHVAPFSSRGPNPADDANDEAWRKPDLLAPGANITAACHSSLGSASDNDNSCTRSGTSMAVPHVSGLAAILLQADRAFPDGDPLTAAETKDLLTNTAEDMGPQGWDKDHGYGYLDGYAAVVEAVNRAPVSAFTAVPEDPEHGQTVLFDASTSHDPDGDSIEDYVWSFDDWDEPRRTSTPTLERVFEDAGTYSASLTTVDEHGAEDPHPYTEELTVRKAPPDEARYTDPPDAQLSIIPSSPRATQPTTLTAEGSTDPDGHQLVEYRWDLDHDDTQGFHADEVTGDATLTITPDEHGVRTFAVRVVDETGLNGTATLEVLIQEPPPPAPVLNITDPQEGDEVHQEALLASWTVENDVDRFTVHLDGEEVDATLERQMRVNATEGNHTLRIEAHGPGGSSAESVNFTVTPEPLEALDEDPEEDEAEATDPEASANQTEDPSGEDDPAEAPLPLALVPLALSLAARLAPGNRAPRAPP